MSDIKTINWTLAHIAVLESHEWIIHPGAGTQITPAITKQNSLHFAIPTPILDDQVANELGEAYGQLAFGPKVTLSQVDVYEGPDLIASFKPKFTPEPGPYPVYTWTLPPPTTKLKYGVGVSLRFTVEDFSPDAWITVIGAGAGFVEL